MHRILLKGGTIVDSAGTRKCDILVEGNGISSIGNDLPGGRGVLALDCHGCIVSPGFVDLHTHLRQPGNERAETVESGTRAAAAGGYTAVVCMPNTDPAIDNASVVKDILALSVNASCQVVPAGAITVNRAGEQLAPMSEMKDLGVSIFTDDGRGVQDAAVMRRALEYASGLDVTLAQHCEVEQLSTGGVMHEGEWSSRLGLAGVPREAEEIMMARDIALAQLAGARLHFMHVSTAMSTRLLLRARQEGLEVTAEVTPHHISLTDAMLSDYDTVYRVNPPLRTAEDVYALRDAVAAGLLDAIATDHAPHAPEERDIPMDQAPPGMIGLETALGVAISSLVKREWLPPHPANVSQDAEVSEREVFPAPIGIAMLTGMLSWQPAAIAGLDAKHGGRQGGPLQPGAPANITVFDPDAVWVVDPASLLSRSRNTPFAGMKLTGKVLHTIYEGEPVYNNGQATR
ncbi:MAG: dihydroorotase [Actinobacteria bacterium]|nr:dihydroorotase [Actinomycetota bacterium]